jgi:sugar fermentation stimulation protein A
MAEKGINTCVLFLVHFYGAEYFMADYHTDLLFAQTFLECKNLNIIPLAIEWKDELSFSGKTKILTIPWKVIEQEAKDRGSYLILMELKERKPIETGKMGIISYESAFYVYTGSAMANLTQRINRHRRLRKNHHWHIDYFREHAEIITDIPVRASEDLECALAKSLSEIADFSVENFGSSDCKCKSHLFGFRENPLLRKEFIKVIQYFRIDRLETVISEQ